MNLSIKSKVMKIISVLICKKKEPEFIDMLKQY